MLALLYLTGYKIDPTTKDHVSPFDKIWNIG